LVVNHTVRMRISILKGLATEAAIFEETYNPNPIYVIQGITQVGTPGTSSFHNVPGDDVTLISDGNRFWVICL